MPYYEQHERHIRAREVRSSDTPPDGGGAAFASGDLCYDRKPAGTARAKGVILMEIGLRDCAVFFDGNVR